MSSGQGTPGVKAISQRRLPGVPSIGIDDGTLGFGSDIGLPQTFHENIYTYGDTVSIHRGKHNLSAGVERASATSRIATSTLGDLLTPSSTHCFSRQTRRTPRSQESIQDLPETRPPTWRPMCDIGGTGR